MSVSPLPCSIFSSYIHLVENQTVCGKIGNVSSDMHLPFIADKYDNDNSQMACN